MPTYASTTDLQNLIGGADDLRWLTDPTNSATDSNAVTAALTTATSVIDSHAIGTPGATGSAGALWDSTPDQAKYACAWLALYLLYVQIRREEIPEHVKSMYDFWMGQLKELREGKISWVATETPAAQNVATASYVHPYDTPRSTSKRRATRYHTDNL